MHAALTPPATIGFVGLGNMGGPMARNLIKAGYIVTGFDTDKARLDRFVSAGGKPAASAADSRPWKRMQTPGSTFARKLPLSGTVS